MVPITIKLVWGRIILRPQGLPENRQWRSLAWHIIFEPMATSRLLGEIRYDYAWFRVQIDGVSCESSLDCPAGMVCTPQGTCV